MEKMAVYFTALDVKFLIGFRVFHIYQMTFFLFKLGRKRDEGEERYKKGIKKRRRGVKERGEWLSRMRRGEKEGRAAEECLR